MKKILLAFLLFLTYAASGQTIVDRSSSPSIIARDQRAWFKLTLRAPVFADTTAANTAIGKDSLGLLIVVPSIHKVYFRDTAAGAHKWTEFALNTPGTVNWADLGGSPSDNSSLMTLFDAKQDAISTGSTSQYFRGDLSLATFPTDNTAFTNGANYLTSALGKNSITGTGVTGDEFELDGDVSSPGASKYYGTNGGGTKGYYTLPTATPFDTLDISGIHTENYFNTKYFRPADSVAFGFRSTGWNDLRYAPIFSLTTTGSGNATYSSGVLNIPNYTYTLPTASESVLGGVKIDGTTITIDDGVISAVGGVSTDTIEATVGSIFKSDNFSSLSDFTNNGGTFSASGGAISASGGAGLENFTQSLDYNYYTGAPIWENTMLVTTATKAAGVGFSVGIRTTNTYIGVGIAAQFDGSDGSSNGRVILRGYRAGNFIRLDSTSAISYTAGDKILLTIQQNRYFIDIYAKNYTTNSATVHITHGFGLLSTSDILANTGKFCFFQHGGSQTIDSISISTNILKYPAIVLLSDSRGYGDYVGDYSQAFASILASHYGSLVNLSKPGDRTGDILNRINEAVATHAKQAIIMLGVNDISSGVDSATTKTNIAAIDAALTAAGMTVWHLLPVYSSTYDQAWLKNYIQRTYPHWIDTWTPTANCSDCRTSDGTHYNIYGNHVIAKAILDTNVLIGGRMRISDTAVVRGNLMSGTGALTTIPTHTYDNVLVSDNVLIYDRLNRRLGIFPSVGPSSGITQPRYTLDLDNGTAYARGYKLNPASGGAFDIGTITVFKSVNGLIFNNGSFVMGLDNSSLGNLYVGSGTANTSIHIFDRGGNDYFSATNGSSVSSMTIGGGSVYAGASNTNAGTFIIQGPRATGTGTPGDITFALAAAGSSGSTLQTLTNRWWMKGGSAPILSNRSAADPLATLDLSGTTTQGFLPPVLTSAQITALSGTIPPGLTIYCSDCTATDASTGVVQTYNGTAWKNAW